MSRPTETDRELSRISSPTPVIKLLFSGTEGVLARQWALAGRALQIGREVDLDAGIALPRDAKASAAHARIRAVADRVIIEDLGSKNGTYVNGQRQQQTQIDDGDVIRIGNSLLLLRRELPGLGDAPPAAAVVHELFLGSSPAVRALRQTVARAGPQAAPVLLLGPTGTGKELAAQALHVLSGRRGPLVRVNSSAITASLAESTLFGHAEGAFTNARRHPGIFREADGGTLFLDEIGDLPVELQPKLLRALEEQHIWPVGARRAEPCNVRILAATNHDLQAEAQRGRFRSDLYARLAALPIALPPLHARVEDILPLFVHRLQLPERALSARLCEALLLYPWPENVRELLNLAEYARTFAADSGPLDLPLLAARLSRPATPAPSAADEGQAPTTAEEPPGRSPRPAARRGAYNEELLVRLLTEHRGVLARVAESLGVSRRQLGRILDKFGIELGSYRRGPR